MRPWLYTGILLVCAAATASEESPPDPAALARALAKECEARPEDLDARRRLGEAWLAAHDLAAADRAFMEVLAKRPEDAAALFGRGRAAQGEGRWNDAARYYGLAIDKDPLWEPSRTRLARVTALDRGSGSKEVDAAIEEAIALPTPAADPLVWEWAVQRAIERRDPALATERAKELIRRFPDSPWGPSILAWVYERQGKDDEAERAYVDLARIRAALTHPPQRTRLSLPFEGRWKVIQGPGGKFSHRAHRPAHSWDLQAIDNRGNTYAGKGGLNEEYFSFAKPLLAPADGWVADVLDGVADSEPGSPSGTQHRGNYVIIEHAPGEFSRFLHLQKGSVAVKPGQRVVRGELIGRCGNSGYSSVPHLHFDLCTGTPPGDASRPAVFERYVRIRNWNPLDVADGCPDEGQWIEPFRKE